MEAGRRLPPCPATPVAKPETVVEPSKDIVRLLAIMARLRDPQTGCSWDVEQTFRSIIPYTIEEAYEVADAVERHDMEDLRDELGDLLLQVVFHSRMAEEAGQFDFGDVVSAITGKLIRRHPHVFGDARAHPPAEVKALWQSIKAEEKRERAARRGPVSETYLDAVPTALPPLAQALKLQTRAATVGFDWNDAHLVARKIEEELGEVASALDSGDKAAVSDEIGDLLFAAVNLARHADVDPEAALSQSNAKFRRRFGHIEQALRNRGEPLEGTPLAVMEALWQDAKAHERDR